MGAAFWPVWAVTTSDAATAHAFAIETAMRVFMNTSAGNARLGSRAYTSRPEGRAYISDHFARRTRHLAPAPRTSHGALRTGYFFAVIDCISCCLSAIASGENHWFRNGS